jgi:pyrroloquinoline quinone (PQQ) biosynthesis protein C
MTQFADALSQLMLRCHAEAPTVQKLLDGTLKREELFRVVVNQYAEIRTFVDFLLPERMRLCPHDAYSARKYFWYLYQEEQGDFVPGKNHAEIFIPVADQLKVPREALQKAYERHLPRYFYMMDIQPSRKALVRELAISYAWESFLAILGGQVNEAVQKHYGLTDISYFTEHSDVDPGHCEQSLAILSEYADTPELHQLSFAAIRETLVTKLYLDW